jgi:hypothetical protein
MSQNKKLDRLHVYREDIKTYYDKLKEKHSPFSGAANKELFLAAMVIGFYEGGRIEVKSPKEGYIFEDYLSPSERKLLNTIAVYEEKKLEVLLDKEKVFQIAEEYAAGGITILSAKVFSGDYGTYSKKMENELLEKFKKTLEKTYVKTDEIFNFDEVNINELINKNESNELEFKSSLLWDYVSQKRTKIPEMAVAKAISAFMNSTGGFLIIGVDDNKNILGLDNDLNLLKDKNLDDFELHLTNTINANLNKLCRPFINISFEKINDKYIALLKIKKFNKPVYLKNEGKVEFFIRSGNSSQPLDISDATTYIRAHWTNIA